MSEKYLPPADQAKCFFLTSPFIEPAVLPHVFASLLRDGRLTEDDLHGLAPDKLDAIRHMAHA